MTESENVVIVTSPGPQGPPGPAGADGSSGGLAYSFVQASPSSVWVINHLLNSYPTTTVIIGGEEWLADVSFNSLDQITVTFASPQSGRAELRG